MIELALLRPQTHLDVAQAFPVRQLSEGHATILIPTREVLDVLSAAIAPDTTPEGMLRKVIQHLRENELACVHAPIPSSRERMGNADGGSLGGSSR